MEWPIVLLVVGLVVVVGFVLVAIRGSFRDDDAFYGESGTVGGASGPTGHDDGGRDAGDESGAGDDGGENVGSDDGGDGAGGDNADG
jgi:hypothetical protein